MKLPHDDPGYRAAEHIIETLRAGGHEALLAGGCVRDLLLARAPKDYDVATDAPPSRVLEFFPKGREVGAKFGVILVRKYGDEVEVATFRTEGPYSDGRRPDHVTFSSADQDAKRRDFTINGIFFDPKEQRVIDYVGGQEDLRRGVLRTIGDPSERFAEDHLRMLRAVRLAARLGFAIESRTKEEIARAAPLLAGISPERIWMELEQILTHPSRAAGWNLLLELGLRAHLSPDWPADAGRDETAGQRLVALPSAEVSAQLALAAVLADVESSRIEPICRSLRLSNRLTRDVRWLVTSLGSTRLGPPAELADLKILMADPCWPELPVLLRADLTARHADLAPLEELAQRAAEVSPQDVAPPPLISGNDLAAMGIAPGPRFGEVLARLYRDQLNERLRTRDEALAEARRLLGT